MDYSLPGSSVHEIMLQAMMLHFHFTSLTLVVIQIFLQCLMNLLSNSGIEDTFYYLIRIIFIFDGFPDSSIREESTCNWRRDRLPNPVFLAFPCRSAGKESACNARDLGLIPGLGQFPGERTGYSLQYSGPENSMDCIVHGITKSLMWLLFLKEMLLFSTINCMLLVGFLKRLLKELKHLFNLLYL